jgi:hypothetical protein
MFSGVWKSEWTLALVPIGGALILSLIVAPISLDAAQWVAIIWFFGSLPFVIGRLIDRAR